MKQQPIGNTGLSVTAVGFGTSALGDMPDTYGYGVDEAQARATINAIFDSPINLVDTARNYGLGRSEERLGAVIRERGGLPDGFVLSSKLDRDTRTNRFDGNRARQSLEQSLTTLGLERIQVLHLHDPEYAADISEITGSGGALETLFRIKEEGLAQAVGLAMGRLDLMLPMLEDWPFDVLITHNRFTLLNRSAEILLDKAQARGITVFNAAPFAGGVLAKGSVAMPRITYQEQRQRELAPVRAIEDICAKNGVAVAAAALQCSLRDPRIASTLVGISTPARIAQTLAHLNTAIDAQTWEALDALPVSMCDPEADRDYTLG